MQFNEEKLFTIMSEHTVSRSQLTQEARKRLSTSRVLSIETNMTKRTIIQELDTF